MQKLIYHLAEVIADMSTFDGHTHKEGTKLINHCYTASIHIEGEHVECPAGGQLKYMH